MEDKAILVAICYEGTASELEGPKYDLEAMKKLLIEKFDFKSENMTILKEGKPSNLGQEGSEGNLGSLPTRENILRELNSAAEDKNLGRLFFYFSGHGTRVRNNEVSESDNEETDSLLYCLDRRCIRDDEMHEIFSKFDKKTKIFSFVDSCFSGTISDLNFIYDKDFKLTKTKRREIKSNVVQLSASLDTQPAADSSVGGIMTLNFIKSIERSDRITYFDLMRKLYSLISDYQTPFLSSSYKLDGNSTFFCSKRERPFIKLKGT